MAAAIDVEHFAVHGWVLTRTHDRVADVVRWVDEVAGWPEAGGEWLHHRELTDDGPKLCRTENFVPFHDGLRALLTTGAMLEAAGALLGEEAVLYKEKINYKLPGGAGYAPHQDAPAYPFVLRHVSCMVAVDDALVANGCLEVVSGHHHELLPTDPDGCLRDDVVAGLEWSAVEVRAGETLWFHSRTPHRSGPNLGASPRRALYPTYNARAEGDLRAAYYEQKRVQLARAQESDPDSERVAVSLIGDFQGRPVRMTTRRAGSVDEVLALFERWGPQRYDEAVTQLEHALQTAALAEAAGADDALVAAALLHDVGHLLELADGRFRDGVDHRHEDRGAAYLAPLVPAGVTAPIALHVRAKRYLCATDPAYAAQLSAGSTASLARQGGPMAPDEVVAFERLAGAAAAVALRRWDDLAKELDLDVGSLDRHRALLERLAADGSTER